MKKRREKPKTKKKNQNLNRLTLYYTSSLLRLEKQRRRL